jgi:hypothetical protein
VEVGDWPGFAQPVRLSLDPQTTVLVGKNGVGKSLLLEGFYLIARQAVSFIDSHPEREPRFLRCEVEAPSGLVLAYECRAGEPGQAGVEGAPRDESDPVSQLVARFPAWSERGFLPGDGTERWRVAAEMLSIPGKAPRHIARSVLWLFYRPEDDPEIAGEVRTLKALLSGIRLIRSGTLRREAGDDDRGGRRTVLFERVTRGERGWDARDFSEVDRLGEDIMALWEKNKPLHEEFVEILQGLGLVRDVSVDLYEESPAQGRSRAELAAILFDGTNLGCCSDGTLRIARIVMELLRPGVSCLLLEEPETAVHPGLLDKLLALVDSYATDRQIVLSTHAPQVVDHFDPAQLRLVTRDDGVTAVSPLSAADRDLAVRYLRDQGSLADFMFRRSDG